MFRRLRWRIALPYVALILVATLGLTVYISDQVRQVRLADLETQLLADARLLAGSVAPLLQEGTNPEALDELARRWAASLEARVTMIGADGTVLGESDEDRTEMDNHLLRPEVQQALRAGQGSSMRYSATLGYEMMYAAVPIQTGQGPALGVMRVALPLDEIEANVGRLRHDIVLAGLVMALAATLLAVFIAGRTTQPVSQLTAVAERTVFVRMLEAVTSGKIFGLVDPTTANGRTIISAGLTLGLLILPLIIINAQEAIKAVPNSLRQAGMGLGATQWQTIWHHVLPNAMPGILTGTILAVSRAIGETAPLVVVGASTLCNKPLVFRTIPHSL